MSFKSNTTPSQNYSGITSRAFGGSNQSSSQSSGYTKKSSFSQGASASSEEIAKKIKGGIQYWAKQPLSLEEMMVKFNPSWIDTKTNDSKTIGVNVRNIIYYLARSSRGDVLREFATRDPEFHKKASFDKGFKPLNGAVWNEKGACSAVIDTLHVLLTKYNCKIFSTATEIKDEFKNETVFGALLAVDNPLSVENRQAIYDWLIGLPEEFYMPSLQDYMNKVSEDNLFKFQTKMMFVTLEKPSAPILIFRQALSIKTPQIAYNPLFNTLVSAVFAETQNPNDTEFDEFFSRIDIISRRDEIVSRMISSITEWIDDDYQNMLRKDDTTDRETHVMYSYRNCFAFLGECFSAGICKNEILEYIMSKVTSQDAFTKSWISRAFVHFLIQSKFNPRTSLENEQEFLSIAINCIYRGASVKTKVEFGTAFMILLNAKKMINDDVILSFANIQERLEVEEVTVDESASEGEDEDDIPIDQAIVRIVRRVEDVSETDLHNYEDDLSTTFEQSSSSNREKCFSILNGLYDINIKKGKFLDRLASFINKNIKTFKKEFTKLVDENEEIIDDIQIDNPDIRNIIKIFL
jgi:hypothetical protein